MFKTLKSGWPKDQDLPQRAFDLSILTRVLDGTIYDKLQYPFHVEKDPNNIDGYIELRKRRPSVRYGLCGLVVDDSISLLFSEGHFPKIECDDKDARDELTKLVKEISLNEVMIDAATRGSVGSVAILLRVLGNRPFLSVMTTAFLTPAWKKNAPDTLERVVERYKVKGADLVAAGYVGKFEDAEDYWFQRDFTAAEEVWYLPLKVSDEKGARDAPPRSKARAAGTPKVDVARTVNHGLGFVPIVWIRNLPGGDDTDGACTFPDEAIDTGIEIDYQLSQVGRGLKYSSDPTLLIKEPTSDDAGAMVKGAGNAIVVDQGGDAKLLEINGTAATAVIEYVRLLREFALEKMHGNRASADKMSAAQSGRALELMNQALIWLADRLRISYGERGLLALLTMIIAAHAKLGLKFKNGVEMKKIDVKTELTLRWPAWYQPTMEDMQQRAQTLQTLCDANLMSIETAIKVLAAEYDIEDPAAEKLLADADMEKRNAEAMKQVKINE